MGDKACDIEWEYLDGGRTGAVAVGELVSAAAGGLPIYRVIEIAGVKALLRDIRDRSERTAALNEMHWRARETMSA